MEQSIIIYYNCVTYNVTHAIIFSSGSLCIFKIQTLCFAVEHTVLHVLSDLSNIADAVSSNQ